MRIVKTTNNEATCSQQKILALLALTVIIVLMLFLWEGNKGFNQGDEGFLWYGVQRVMLGEVPIRDFMSYDPGRYYWSATLMRLFADNGVMALRGTLAAFQALGVFVSLLLVASAKKRQSYLYLLLVAVTTTMCMITREKLFDASLPFLLMGALTLLVQAPNPRRYFFTGLFVGLAAVFGRNHGLYGAAGSLGVILWLRINGPIPDSPRIIKGVALWTAGIFVGFSPIIFMMLLVPGFSAEFWGSIRFLFEIKATNLPLPVPWPWTVGFHSIPLRKGLYLVLVGLFFIAIIVFGVFSLAWVIWQRCRKKYVSPAFVASSFLALPYAHYAYSRAEAIHLELAISPLLIGCLVLLSAQRAKIKWPLSLLLCMAIIMVALPVHPGWRCAISNQCVKIEVSGSDLYVSPDVAGDIRMLRKISARYAPDGQSFIAAPYWPSAYALLERKSPMWELFGLFPRSKSFEIAELKKIKAAQPKFVLLSSRLFDNQQRLLFRNTHPVIYKYILHNFKLVRSSSRSIYKVYRLKDAA